MNAMKLTGIVLIVFGLIAFFYNGIPYKQESDAVKIGPVKITTEEKKSIPVSPVVGGLAVAGGVVLLAVGGKRQSHAS